MGGGWGFEYVPGHGAGDTLGEVEVPVVHAGRHRVRRLHDERTGGPLGKPDGVWQQTVQRGNACGRWAEDEAYRALLHALREPLRQGAIRVGQEKAVIVEEITLTFGFVDAVVRPVETPRATPSAGPLTMVANGGAPDSEPPLQAAVNA